MSKTALPDEILDAVAGGRVTYQGELVTNINVTTDSMTITVGGKTYTSALSDKEKADMASTSRHARATTIMMNGLINSSETFSMEEIASWSPDDD